MGEISNGAGHLVGLNENQKRAVLHKDGALLILAGAGAGKTRVIVHRIAELIRSGVAPEKILAVTFTNKAAREMRERVGKILHERLDLSPYDLPAQAGIPKTSPFIGTFHALSLHIIKTFHGAAGLPVRFTIYDRADSTKTARDAIQAVGFDPKQLEPRRVLSVMSKYKGQTISLEEFRNEHSRSYIDEAIADVWEKYESALKKENALDFDDILVVAHRLLMSHEPAKKHFEDAWDYLHVDEYQDTNRIQYELVEMLSKRHGNIVAVGDIDQNIYSWRGASIEHIMNFEKDFPSSEVIVLAENYRSTKTILAAANDAIAKNIKRREKELYTENPEGEKIAVAGFTDENEEAAFIAKESKRLIRGKADPDGIAVLYRANFQSRVLEEAFLKANVPYQVLGTRFFERKEVKDALSYIRAALNPDSAADLARAIATPSRGIGKVTLAKVVNRMEAELPPIARRKIDDFRAVLSRIKRSVETKTASEAVRDTLSESGMWKLYEDGDSEDVERLENLKELVTVASKYDGLPAGDGIEKLIEEASLQSDQDELDQSTLTGKPKHGVKLMTVHAAKGLEFNTVFICGLEDGLFPHERDESDGVDEEEERRLFYVALTRAKKNVCLSYAATRRIFGTRSIHSPSEFITELDPVLAEVVAFPMWHDEEIIR